MQETQTRWEELCSLLENIHFFQREIHFLGFPKTFPKSGLDDELSLLAQKLRDILIARKNS